MNSMQFNIRQLLSRPLSSLLNVILFATGVTIISLIFLLRDSFEKQMEKNAAGIDLVVGAKGSPLQLILSGIYHVDYPTGNIGYREAMELAENPLIKQAIPLALGDNYKGFRIVGTTPVYPGIYQAQLKEGEMWGKELEVCIGSKVALETGLTVGGHFTGVHGLVEEVGHAHDDTPYLVKGIFKETGTVLDQLILTTIESVWKIHEHHGHDPMEREEHSHDDHHVHGPDCDHIHDHHPGCTHTHDSGTEGKEITTLLIQYKSPMGAITLPRLINQSTYMQAASPVQEVNRLYSLLGVGIQALTYISGLIIVISGLSIFISLLNSLKERKYELALIRAMGGSRLRLFTILLLEGISLAIIGYLTGFILSRIVIFLLSSYTDTNFHYTLDEWFSVTDVILLLVSLVIGALAAVFPAIRAMHTDISKTLSQ